MSWKVTVRHGSQVEREKRDSLEEALSVAAERARRVLAEGAMEPVSAFRTYEPGERVQARIEISGPGLLRGPEAGIDVMGDGAVVPYKGALRKQRLDANGLEGAIERLREALDE